MAKLALPPECWFFFEKAGLTRSDIYRLLPEIQAAVLDRVESQRIPEIKVLPAPKFKRGPHKTMRVGYVALPLLKNEAAAGAPRFIDEREIEDYIIVPARYAKPGPDWITCIRVAGDSMEPVLRDGYIVAVDASVADERRLQHKMVVALVDEGATIKWLDRVGKQWVLTPENKAYRQHALSSDDKIIGRVAWWYGHQD
ncbi:MAG: helix-turn-helix transcriptional regulator [Terriglobia bacterium]